MVDHSTEEFFRCNCYYSGNYYIADYDLHVQYWGDDKDFLITNRKILERNACNTEERTQKVLDTIHVEFQRRKNLDTERLQRRDIIRASYTPLHQEVYVLKEEWFEKKFLDAVRCAKQPEITRLDVEGKLQKEKASGVYRLPVFNDTFCKMFLEELEHFEQSEMPKARPNTMNKSGILLGEMGFDETFTTPLREGYLNPLAKVLYPEWVGASLDSHRAFTVKYKEGEDLDLGFHYDNAEVTLNVSLGKMFDDGSLYFGSMRQESRKSDGAVEILHAVGEGILHRGQHMHGAMPISSGERVNLIIWMRASSVRNKLCPMCDNEPTLVPATGFGDGFTIRTDKEVEICNAS